ncbi:hypothetical protein C8J57DRAFT_1368824 [Mycena rebaudengoi]|nr:hypothetical protein C8J57DRAFT_1368824 [Mycena rebaudengoi]
MSHTSPSLPLELEREIFEIAATHHPETMPILLLVAQRVLQWHLQPAKLKHIQHLLLWGYYSDLLPVLPLCVHVERLGLRSEDPSMVTAFEAMPLALQHSSFINSSTLDAIDPSRPLFRTLTHLDMFAGTEGQPLNFQFAQFPALSHLGMHGARPPPFFFDLLLSCPRLHVLISKIWFWSSWNRMQAHQPIDADPRFVMMFTEASINHDIQDWTLGAQGGKNLWARAELFIDKRRRGEIEPASRFWIEESDQI